MTYIYSIMFVLLSGSLANNLVFGQAVLIASTPEGTPIDHRLQKFFAIALVAVICLLQSYSRVNYVRFSNCFAVYKIFFLTIVTIILLCALSGVRTAAAKAAASPGSTYGVMNLQNSFSGGKPSAYAVALALLDITRVYSGYENANFVCDILLQSPLFMILKEKLTRE